MPAVFLVCVPPAAREHPPERLVRLGERPLHDVQPRLALGARGAQVQGQVHLPRLADVVWRLCDVRHDREGQVRYVSSACIIAPELLDAARWLAHLFNICVGKSHPILAGPLRVLPSLLGRALSEQYARNTDAHCTEGCPLMQQREHKMGPRAPQFTVMLWPAVAMVPHRVHNCYLRSCGKHRLLTILYSQQRFFLDAHAR